MSMQIKGMKSLINKLNTLGGNAEKALYNGVGKAVALVEGDAKDLCPAPTGELRDSINSSVEKKQGEIIGSAGTSKEYAAYVEFGTGQRGAESPSPPKKEIGDGYREDWAGMAAQPYLYPALMQNKEEVVEIVAEELKAEIRKLGAK